FAGAAHELVALHAVAVVGDRDDAGFGERADRGKGFALHVDGDAAGGQHFYHGIAFDDVFDVLDRAGVARGRRGVGHADDGGETAGGGAVGAGGDVLLVRLTGFTEVNVDVDETGAGDEVGAVDDLGLFFV